MAAVCALVVLRARSLARLNCFLPDLLYNRKQSLKGLSNVRYYSTTYNVANVKTDLNDNDETGKPQKKPEETKITLFLPDNSLMVTDLENATKISKRRGLVLIKVEEINAKSNRPVYKLINQTEQLEQEFGDKDNEVEKENVIKSIKTIQISAKITLHDLNTKLKNVNKLLERKHKVKIILTHGSNMQDKIVKSIETNTKNLATIQRLVKSSTTIFTITPILNGLDNNKLDDVDTNKKR